MKPKTRCEHPFLLHLCIGVNVYKCSDIVIADKGKTLSLDYCGCASDGSKCGKRRKR